MTPMTTLTLGQAAKLTGLGKTTLTRAIRAGRLSATRNDTGGYTIDAAELARVYPFPAPASGHPEGPDATGVVAHHATANATLEGEVAHLREMLAMMREQAADLREDRDRWRDQASRLALPAPRPQEPAPATPATSWWKWLRTSA
jgi:excisionase family DNA binding protein